MFSTERRRWLAPALMLLIAGGLWAGTIDSNTVSFDFQGSFNGTFTQFNPALGTLTGVTLFYNNTVLSINPEVQTPEALTPVSLYANFTEGLYLTLPGGVSLSPFLDFTVNYGCTATQEEFNSCGGSQLFMSGAMMGSMALSPSPNLGAYIGSSTVALMLETGEGITNIESSFPDPVIGTNLGTGGTDDTGDVYLQYTYTPASTGTPEPASMALMAGGLVALVWLRRRR